MLTSRILFLSITLLTAHSYLHAAAATDKSILSQLSSESLTNEQLVTILNSSDSNQISNALQQLNAMPERRVMILQELKFNSLSHELRNELLTTLRWQRDCSLTTLEELEKTASEWLEQIQMNQNNCPLTVLPKVREKVEEMLEQQQKHQKMLKENNQAIEILKNWDLDSKGAKPGKRKHSFIPL